MYIFVSPFAAEQFSEFIEPTEPIALSESTIILARPSTTTESPQPGSGVIVASSSRIILVLSFMALFVSISIFL